MTVDQGACLFSFRERERMRENEREKKIKNEKETLVWKKLGAFKIFSVLSTNLMKKNVITCTVFHKSFL